MTITTVLVAVLWLCALCSAAPTRFDKALSDTEIEIYDILDRLCASKSCLFGRASFNSSSFSCACPAWPDPLFSDPCKGLTCEEDAEPFYSVIANACYCDTMENWYKLEDEVYNAQLVENADSIPELRRRQTPTTPDPAVDTAVPTFIPPPKQDLTPELLNQSLTVQPQNTATVSSMIPFFHDNVIQVYMQLNGLVADTLVVNCSASLPCGTIGITDPQPNLAMVPQTVQQGQGQPQVAIADCQCIAVNMYTPNVITYWIQKISDGTIYSVVGSNKVIGIDQMDTTQSTALTLVTLPKGSKRSLSDQLEYIQPERRQIFSIQCDQPCPFYHMHVVRGSDGYCGCMFNGSDEELHARAILEPNVHTASMSAEACAAMKCFNSGGAPGPAVFNPFTLTCWCMSQPYIESNPSAWSPST